VAGWTHADLARFCAGARPITKGALNDTYAGELGDRPVFVRHRILDDPEFGQTFAAERYARPLVDGRVSIPELLAVVPDARGLERYAVFEYVDGAEPDWDAAPVLRSLAEQLALVHSVPGDGFGDLGRRAERVTAPRFVETLLRREIARAPRQFAPAAELVPAAAGWFAGERPCLCHGDVWQANWLSGRDGTLWALDWEAARFRVAAADFNQMQADWLTPAQRSTVLTQYLALTGRDPEVFAAQVAVLRFLWHLRTYNFHVLAARRPPAEVRAHLTCAADLLDRIPPHGRR
jgi:hypothetical protein